MTSEKVTVWDGVYPSFREAPIDGHGFDDPIWGERSRRSVEQARADVRAGRPLDYSVRQRNGVLASVVATLLGERDRIRVLDFGGGPGFGFVWLESVLRSSIERVDYVVVEKENVCAQAAEIFTAGPKPTFASSIPVERNFDLAFSASSVQYLEDWREICDRLASLEAPYLLFSDLYVGTFSAFVTMQSYYGSRIAHWMLNRDEVVEQIERRGYRLQLDTPCDGRILGVYGDVPMENFPEHLRLKQSSHLMFTRRKK